MNADLSMTTAGMVATTQINSYQAGWICLNAFYARLTVAKLLRYEWAAAL